MGIAQQVLVLGLLPNKTERARHFHKTLYNSVNIRERKLVIVWINFFETQRSFLTNPIPYNYCGVLQIQSSLLTQFDLRIKRTC